MNSCRRGGAAEVINLVSSLSDPELERLLRKLHSERGLDAHHYRESYLQRRIATRLRALQLDSIRDYSRLLDEDPDEYANLLNALTVNVSDFFRDKPVFDFFIRNIVPELLSRKKRRHQHLVRVWSAGCATGEEPYSLAMVLLAAAEAFNDYAFNMTIYATDIDEASMAAAQSARYSKEDKASIPPVYHRFCIQDGDGEFSIAREARQLVKFRRLDLFADKPIAAVDVIFCRNVFIYFGHEQQERIFDVFHESLNKGGYLIIGKSEKLPAGFSREFEPLSSREKVYRRRE